MNTKKRLELNGEKQLNGCLKVKDVLKILKKGVSVSIMNANYDDVCHDVKKVDVPKRLLKETCEIDDYVDFFDILVLRLTKYELTK